MKRCPITYEIIDVKEDYSKRGLKMLSLNLTTLEPLDFSAAEQRAEAIARIGKMSIQGVQAKLSARLKAKERHFELVDQYGQYILKPQSEYYPELPENEAITMSLAAMIGLEVPLHGLIYSKDKSMTYFIKRFDRKGRNEKIAIEDFAQLSRSTRDTKYNSSMEKVAKIIFEFCSFPQVEAIKLFKLTLFNFLIGNEDMHLKNFSLITQPVATFPRKFPINFISKICLSPSYDLLNTTIAQKNTKEELALPLNGKKNNLARRDFIDYFAIEILKLNQNTITEILYTIKHALPKWQSLIENSFLSQTMKEKYLKLLEARCHRLALL